MLDVSFVRQRFSLKCILKKFFCQLLLGCIALKGLEGYYLMQNFCGDDSVKCDVLFYGKIRKI